MVEENRNPNPENRLAMVIIDIRMPRGNGIEVLENIMKSKDGS